MTPASAPRLRAISIVGASGSGKTTLMLQLLAAFAAQSRQVAAVKHSSHAHPLHKPGSDSESFERAGAAWVGFATPSGLSLIQARTDDASVLHGLTLLPAELVLVEGWKSGPLKKVEVWRPALGPSLAEQGLKVEGLVSDDAPPPSLSGLPRYSPSDIKGLTDFLWTLAGVT